MRKGSALPFFCLISLFLICFFFGQTACVHLKAPAAVNVILKKEGLDFTGKKVAIPDFSVPEHGAGLGVSFADILQSILMERAVFAETSRDLPVVWTHPGETLESRFGGLAEAAEQRGFDFILIGEVERLFYGGLEDTTLDLKLRLIDVRTKKDFFVARHKAVSTTKDQSYPLDTKLTTPADSPRMLAEKTLRQIVDCMF